MNKIALLLTALLAMPVVASAAPAAGQAPAQRSGAVILKAACASCHDNGLMGAPVTGNKKQWAARLAQGNAVVHRNALNGIRAMPPKGGCRSCSNEEIKAAVDIMIARSK
ncbi:c-type cytochrome [Amnimonas aquatica]|uniref:c-type cytochrome n=1 Tax=Amnimonas aquatica TaxID=2094561 RepID=UPI0011B071D8|nr:c-type cytochrome [Amnimonas aquatica]